MPSAPKALRPVDLRVAAILNDAVAASGLSHRTIAGRIGISQNRVSKILRAETPAPTIGELDAIAEAVGIPVARVIDIAYTYEEFKELSARPLTVVSGAPSPPAYTRAVHITDAPLRKTRFIDHLLDLDVWPAEEEKPGQW